MSSVRRSEITSVLRKFVRQLFIIVPSETGVSNVSLTIPYSDMERLNVPSRVNLKFFKKVLYVHNCCYNLILSFHAFKGIFKLFIKNFLTFR